MNVSLSAVDSVFGISPLINSYFIIIIAPILFDFSIQRAIKNSLEKA